MKLQFMTPTEVWEGYNPVKDPLETSIISSEEQDNLVRTRLFFTSEKTPLGRVRVYADIYVDKRWSDPRAALLIAPPLGGRFDCSELVPSFINDGYIVCVIDYAGTFNDNVNHTTFPSDLAYAAYPECNNYLNSIESDARNTPWFQWAKILRRAISVLQEHRLVAEDRIGVIGIGTGAQIAWQTAGIDGRVRALVPVNGGGYLWTSDFDAAAFPSTDADRAFSSGIGAETYARFVTCPTCFVVSSNSNYFSADRAGDLISTVPAICKRLIISPNTNLQITKKTFDAVLIWLRQNFALDGEPFASPSLTFENIEDKLYLKLRTAAEAINLCLYVCHCEPYPAVRYWQKVRDIQKTAPLEFAYNVPVLDKNLIVSAYATVEYADGIVASTPILNVIPQKIGISYDEGMDKAHGKLIYNYKMGRGAFAAHTKRILLEESVLNLKTGPHDIKGICVSEGDLLLYRRAFAKKLLTSIEIFQFDAYSQTKKSFELKLLVSGNKYYTAAVELNGGEFWQKIKLSLPDFKNEYGKALQKFDDAAMFVFTNAENVVINNILWL